MGSTRSSDTLRSHLGISRSRKRANLCWSSSLASGKATVGTTMSERWTILVSRSTSNRPPIHTAPKIGVPSPSFTETAARDSKLSFFHVSSWG